MIGMSGYSEDTVLQTPTHAMSVSVPKNNCAFDHPRKVYKKSVRIFGISVWNVKATLATSMSLPL